MARRPSARNAASDVPEAPPARNLDPLRMVWRMAGRYPRQVLFAALALLTSSTATLTIPAQFKYIVDHAFGAGTGQAEIDRAFAGLLVIVVVLGLATAVRFYWVSWLGERVVADLREAVQRNLLRLPPSFFEANSPKEISSRMTSDTGLIEVVVGTTVSIALRNLITGIGGTAYLFYLVPQLALELLIAIPVIIAPIVWFGRRLSKASRTSQDRIADVGALVTEVLSAMRVVQSFNQEQREADRFTSAVESIFMAARRRITIRAVMTSGVMILLFGSFAVLLWQGASWVSVGRISAGTLTAFVTTGIFTAGSFGALTEVYGDLLRGAGAASRLNELLNEQPLIAAPDRPIALPAPPRGQLSFERVSFRYPSRPDTAAIGEFSLTIEPGETVALVGPSGAGKSTVFQLAQRFYDPQAGTIKLDGVPLTSSYKTSYTPSIEAVQEVSFQKNAVDAEYGYSAGGIVTLNMKSGTNKFHGSAYYHNRNPRFNAFGDPTIPRVAGADETIYRGTNLKMYGGTIGGPIVKNKVFFFSSWEQWFDHRPITVKITVPTALERKGDFSQSRVGSYTVCATGTNCARPIYDPFTSRRHFRLKL